MLERLKNEKERVTKYGYDFIKNLREKKINVKTVNVRKKVTLIIK